MLTVINGNLLAANQLAIEIANTHFKKKYFHWHGTDLQTLLNKFKHRDDAIKGAYVANCNDAKTLETLIAKFCKEEMGIIITTNVSFEEPKDYRDGSYLWHLKMLCRFTLITINEY